MHMGKQVSHRDVKSENVLLTLKRIAKLAAVGQMMNCLLTVLVTQASDARPFAAAGHAAFGTQAGIGRPF